MNLSALTAIIAIAGSGCTFGGGPTIAYGRNGVALGFQGGPGFGGAKGEEGDGFVALRGDVAATVWLRRGTWSGHAGGSLMILESVEASDGPMEAYGAGAVLTFAGGDGGMFAAGAVAGRSGATVSNGHAWTVAFGLRLANDGVEVFAWPQLHWWGMGGSAP